MIARFALLVLVTVAALLAGFLLFTPEEAEIAFINFGYVNILCLLAVSTFVILRGNTERIANWAKKRPSQILLATCIAAAAFLYTREGGSFKIAFDEQVLTNVSMNMHQHHIPVISESPLIGFSRYETIDKRPLLFPFLLSLTHDALGYDSSNAFYLNFALTALFLLLLAKVTERVASRAAGYFSIVLACCTPLLAQNVSGGGFEIANLSCLLLVVWLGMDYWKRPGTSELARLAFAGALASHARYESALIVLPIALLVLTKWAMERRPNIPWSVCAVPIFYVSLVWQQRAVAANPGKFQYVVQDDKLFSFDHLAPNLDSAFRFFFIPDNNYAGSPFIGFVGVAGLLIALAFSLTRRESVFAGRPERVALLFFLPYLLGLTGMLAFFFYGQLDNAIVSRLALPIVASLILGGSALLGSIHRASKAGRYASYIFVLCTAFYAFKLYANPRYKDTNFLHARIDWALHFAESQPPGAFLFISTMPLVFENERINTVHSIRAKSSLDKLAQQLEFKTYQEIFALQNFQLDLTDGELMATPLPRNELGPAFILEPVAEASFAPYNFTRISRVRKVDPSLAQDPSEASESETKTTRSTQFKTPSLPEVKKWRESLL